MKEKPNTPTIREAEGAEDRAKSIGLLPPEGVCILPRHFFTASALSELAYEESGQDLRILLRQSGIPIGKIEPDGIRIPYQAEYDSTLIIPAIFLGASFWSQNPQLISVVLGVISNYITDWLKGKVGNTRVALGFVIEKTDKKTTIRIDYNGDPNGLKGIEKLIKDAMK